MEVVCGVENRLTELRYAKAGFSRQADLSVVEGEQPHKNGQPDHAPSANDECIMMNDE